MLKYCSGDLLDGEQFHFLFLGTQDNRISQLVLQLCGVCDWVLAKVKLNCWVPLPGPASDSVFAILSASGGSPV